MSDRTRLELAAPAMIEALIEIRDRLVGHPMYAELTEEDECEVGGDTAELSYLARVANAAINKAEGAT